MVSLLEYTDTDMWEDHLGDLALLWRQGGDR